MEWLLIIMMMGGGIHTQRLPRVMDCPAVAKQIRELDDLALHPCSVASIQDPA